MGSFVYLAYGSNLLEARLRARCPGARRVGTAEVADHVVAYDVRAADGSAKLGLRPAPGRIAYGALWDIAETDRAGLALAEGRNYRECSRFAVRTGAGEPLEVVTWLPLRPPEPARPWHWYRALALAGASESDLPPEARAPLAEVAFDRDPKADRPAFRDAVEALCRAGRLDLLDRDPV